MSDKKESKQEILINRMFSGYDLDRMLGHEAINLIQDDNGNKYFYALPNGGYHADHYGKIEAIINVRGINDNCVQVLGMALRESLIPVYENQTKKLAFELGIKKINNLNISQDDWSENIDYNKDFDKIKTYLSTNNNVKNTNENLIIKLGKDPKKKIFREKLNKLQQNYITNKKITFNEKPLYKLYKDINNNLDINNLAIYITFALSEEGKYYVPKVPLFLQNNNNDYGFKGLFIKNLNTNKLSSQSLANFINNEEDVFEILVDLLSEKFENIKDKIKFSLDYDKKEDILKNFWQELPRKTFMDILKSENTKEDVRIDDNFLEFMGKVDSETIYSNMIVKVLKKYPSICEIFIKDILKVNNININNISIKKEVPFHLDKEKKNIKPDGRIDILIEDENNVIVIENKIKSDLNGCEEENNEIIKTQLNNYYQYVDEEFKNKDKYFFIFTPIYNNIDKDLLKIKNKNNDNEILCNYKTITYKDLFKFFNDGENKKGYKNLKKEDNFYNEFVNDLSIHAKPQDEYHFDLMMRKFTAAIEQARSKNK